jgi:N-acyl-D-aspartate/D-glutamate deacylase
MGTVIRGGLVVDGTGRPGEVRDVAIRDGRFVPLDEVGEQVEVVDADGLVVAPGFVDVHTHYDAQVAWDPTASPSPLHGVTTVIGGNCGFTLAPAGPDHADYLMRMMARVEGMPLAALEAGLDWGWQGFGDWLGRFEGRIGVNAGFLVGHSAIRRAQMGERCHEVATAAEVEAMARTVAAACADGALGFSSSRSPTHHDGAGDPVPSRAASTEELVALAAAVRGSGATALEFIVPGCLNGFTTDELDLLADMSAAAGRPLNWNVLGVSSFNPNGHESQLAAADHARGRGGRVVALTLPHSMRIRLSFLTGTVLDGLPGWAPVLALPVPERLAALRDPEVRRTMRDGAASDEAGILRALADWGRLEVVETFAPANAGYEGRRIADIAAETGADPFDALVDLVVADELRTGLRPGGMRETAADWELRAQVWRDPRAVIGGSDAGAHLDMMCGAVYSTALLGRGVREFGVVSLEEAVRLLTSVPAELYGLDRRGRIADGWAADVVVFDPDRVADGPERTLDDLPSGASRLVAESEGIECVLVGGVAVVAEGRLVGSTPGTVLRSGRDAGVGEGVDR